MENGGNLYIYFKDGKEVWHFQLREPSGNYTYALRLCLGKEIERNALIIKSVATPPPKIHTSTLIKKVRKINLGLYQWIDR